MDSYIGNDTIENIGINKFQKMVFVYNALEDGWTITKNGESYVFKKKHHRKIYRFFVLFILKSIYFVTADVFQNF